MRYRAFITAFLAFCLGFCTLFAGTADAKNVPLTYDQIRGTGLANNCPQLEATLRTAIPIDKGQSYVLNSLCLQPSEILVKEESVNKRQQAEFVPTRLMTRLTSTIESVQGSLTPNADGSLTFTEEDGFDFQAITVQLPGGERVPFLFTIKGLVATTQPGLDTISTATDFEGEFRVPSYRTSNFLDPKGRGLSAGYESAVALPGTDDAELTRENIKQFDIGKGKISLQIAKVNSATGEIAGIFESTQPSETDMGSKKPLDVKIRGTFYARIEPAVG
ncbi:Photosystem II manganese-stabilizing polypeptide [Neosynechococcus sphagnicola sy1]|uniref:Photosystem II extrinsic protein O n=1 Tax=Neosynechococcus sphagnicola sy1 TaxID=1497020 RepID=A0A098TTD4_9CYAN|nr:photosystem II manganese-stabilizing polypeptide [Neosynechococcus sphagnicola]KGF74038.1 Photosystem II manganese-stabilizing polypeptide [Neosynechococcus sphagnicola sy1]